MECRGWAHDLLVSTRQPYQLWYIHLGSFSHSLLLLHDSFLDFYMVSKWGLFIKIASLILSVSQSTSGGISSYVLMWLIIIILVWLDKFNMEEVDRFSLWRKEEDSKRKEELTINNEHAQMEVLSLMRSLINVRKT